MKVILAALLLTAATSGAPDISKAPIIGNQFGLCPDGTVIEKVVYDADPNDPEAAFVVFKRAEDIVAIWDTKKGEIYVTADNKVYSLDEMRDKYPSPCDIPAKGRGI